jgi:hypothetical protein
MIEADNCCDCLLNDEEFLDLIWDEYEEKYGLLSMPCAPKINLDSGNIDETRCNLNPEDNVTKYP